MHTGTQSETCPLRLANPCRPVHTEKKTAYICMHKSTHACMHMHTHMPAHTDTLTDTHFAHIQRYTHACMHRHTYMHVHTCTYALTHTNTHTHAHAHTRSHTHTHTKRDNLAALTSSLFLIPFPGLSTYQKASTCGDWLTWKWTRRGRLGSWLLCLAGSS